MKKILVVLALVAVVARGCWFYFRRHMSPPEVEKQKMTFEELNEKIEIVSNLECRWANS